jgi:hypothetical protein
LVLFGRGAVRSSRMARRLLSRCTRRGPAVPGTVRCALGLSPAAHWSIASKAAEAKAIPGERAIHVGAPVS